MSIYIFFDRLGPIGGIGRRARLKIVFRKEFQFDSEIGHQRLLLKQSSHVGLISRLVNVCANIMFCIYKTHN